MYVSSSVEDTSILFSIELMIHIVRFFSLLFGFIHKHTVSPLSCMSCVSRPHVSIFGHVPVLVLCDFQLIRVQVCFSDYVLICLCI